MKQESRQAIKILVDRGGTEYVVDHPSFFKKLCDVDPTTLEIANGEKVTARRCDIFYMIIEINSPDSSRA